MPPSFMWPYPETFLVAFFALPLAGAASLLIAAGTTGDGIPPIVVGAIAAFSLLLFLCLAGQLKVRLQQKQKARKPVVLMFFLMVTHHVWYISTARGE